MTTKLTLTGTVHNRPNHRIHRTWSYPLGMTEEFIRQQWEAFSKAFNIESYTMN